MLTNINHTVLGIIEMLREYGRTIRNKPLAEIVILLYRAAHSDATRKTYAVGQRHWIRFHNAHPRIDFFPFAATNINPTTLSLCFFVGYLASRPSIKRYTTVRSYICHVKALWRDAGCPENLLHTPLLRRLMRGVRRLLPAPIDAREAFIPPSFLMPKYYVQPPSTRLLLFKAAVTLGFHAMLRYGAFCQFTVSRLTVVLKNGCERAFTSFGHAPLPIAPHLALGVLFTFTPKYTLSNGIGTAFFCHICDVAPTLAMHCPMCVIAALIRNRLLRSPNHSPFDPLVFTPAALTSYLGHVAGKPGRPPSNPFKPHSLRIGGHTYYTIHNMNPDLRDYLARRAITRCSLRYFRASPAENLRALRSFYKRQAPTAITTSTQPAPTTPRHKC